MEVKQITSEAISRLNNIGSHTIGCAKSVHKYMDGAAQTMKDTFQLSGKLKEHNISKETFIGAGILVAGVILAAKCIKGIKHTIENFRKDAK